MNYKSILRVTLISLSAYVVLRAGMTWKSFGTYESTWFSKDRMTGNGDVLKALSAMASITS